MTEILEEDLGGHPLHVDILVAGRYHKHCSSIRGIPLAPPTTTCCGWS
jgi:hypothetical protein